MSGGYWDYADSQLKDDIFGWNGEKKDPFEDKEISDLIRDVFSLMHDFDWYKSGDYSEDAYLEAKKAFKDKWLNISEEDRIQRTINEACTSLKKDLEKTFLNKTEGE